MIWLEEPFKSAWANKDAFLQAQLVSEGASRENLYRHKEGRRTVRFEQDGRSYFLKHHRGIGWKEIFKNILQFRLPVLGAHNEYEAANKLGALGLDTLKPVAFGEHGKNPATQESFLITEDLINTISLEDYCRSWQMSKPAFSVKKALIEKVATTAKTMHENGINHRDFYICHFLLDTKSLLEKSAEQKIQESKAFRCYLIDLHRCQIRQQVPRRWLVKDLGGLFYSALDIGLTRKDCFRFLKNYTGLPLRELLKNALWLEVMTNAKNLYQKDFGKAPREIFKNP